MKYFVFKDYNRELNALWDVKPMNINHLVGDAVGSV